jgi:hypothetical protein
MAFYSAPFTFNFDTSFIDVDSGYVDIDCTNLYTACKLAQASTEGITYERIASGSGLVTLGVGVQVGLTIEFLGSWQLRFPTGNYVARVAGGNLVGGPGGDPIAYTAGVQTLLIQSAASTVVTTGGGGGSGDWTVTEKNQIRHRLGIDGTTSTPSTGIPSLATETSVAKTLKTTTYLGTK